MSRGAFFSKSVPEFAEFRRKWVERVLKPLGLSFLCLYFFLVLLATLGRFPVAPPSYDYVSVQASSSSSPWVRGLAERSDELSKWLEDHGTAGEMYFFHYLSQIVLSDAFSKGESSSGFFRSVHSASIRLSFFLVASGRFILLAFTLAAIYAILSLRPYRAKNLLGLTGNGRLFYSGIRVSLHDLDSREAPISQITGLACPAKTPLGVADRSELGQLLKEYSADSETNLELVQIILAASEHPGFLAEFGYEAILEQRVDTSLRLPEVALACLEKCLEVHQQISEQAQEVYPTPHTSQDAQSRLGLEEYAMIFEGQLKRVLTEELKASLAKIAPDIVATAVLSLFAGRTLAAQKQSGLWVRTSNYPHLSARSVLHSVPSFCRSIPAEEREMVRRALVYGSRSSVFGPVRLVTDLSLQSRALRQWIELLMAPAYELQSIADEVELFALLHESQKLWSKSFYTLFEDLRLQEAYARKVFASYTGTLFVPLPLIIEIYRQAITEQSRLRMKHLLQLVSQKQRIRTLSAEQSEDTLQEGIPEYERVPGPFKPEEVTTLSKEHGIEPSLIEQWSSARALLSSFGWLAHRVENNTAPEHGLVFAVLQGGEMPDLVNEYGYIGVPGSVALRGARLSEQWGLDWVGRFTTVDSAAIAETREQFEKQIKGVSEDLVEDSLEGAV